MKIDCSLYFIFLLFAIFACDRNPNRLSSKHPIENSINATRESASFNEASHHNKSTWPFDEVILDDAGEYNIDVDFDGIEEKINVNEYGDVCICKTDSINGCMKDVSEKLPYKDFRVHLCCPAHKAYTIINYTHRTIYIEAHYGATDKEIKQYKIVGNKWIEIFPITPLSVIKKELY